MHTAVCTFRDRATAERARDHLVRFGFDARDVHLEHRGRDGDGRHAGEDPRGWDGTDHEVAVDRGVVDRVAGFFVHLFGAMDPAGHDRSYGDAVAQGRYVLVVDGRDEADAQRARTLLGESDGEDLNVVHRPMQQPLREIVDGARDPGEGRAGRAHVESPARVQAAFHGRSTDWTDRSEAARERALAAEGSGEQRPSERRDPDLDHVGLRYADQDKPGR